MTARDLLPHPLHHPLHLRLHLAELFRIGALRQVFEDVVGIRSLRNRNIFLGFFLLGRLLVIIRDNFLRLGFLIFLLWFVVGSGGEGQPGDEHG